MEQADIDSDQTYTLITMRVNMRDCGQERHIMVQSKSASQWFMQVHVMFNFICIYECGYILQ